MIRFVRTAFAVGAVALAFTATDTQAQVGFSIGAGPSFAMGDLGDAVDMGYHAKVAASFSVPMLPVGLEADAMWTRFDFSDVDDANMRLLSGTLNAVINLPTPGFTPYLIGGAGFYNSKAEIGDLESDSETDLGVNVGAGVRLGLPGLGIFAEARLHNVFGEDDSIRFVPLSIGVRF